jgi:hypothetical protein
LVRTTKVWAFPSLKLLREDLDEVVSLFKTDDENEIGKLEEQVTITDEENVYPSFDEMRLRKGDDVEHLILMNRDLGLKLDLRRHPRVMTLSTTKATDAAELVFYRVRDFLGGRRRPLNFLVTRLLWGTALLILFVYLVWWFFAEGYKQANTPIHGIGWLFLVLFLASLCFVLSRDSLDKSTSYFVTLKRKHELPSFFKRKKDDLVLMLLGAMVGAALGILGTLVTQKLLSK